MVRYGSAPSQIMGVYRSFDKLMAQENGPELVQGLAEMIGAYAGPCSTGEQVCQYGDDPVPTRLPADYPVGRQNVLPK